MSSRKNPPLTFYNLTDQDITLIDQFENRLVVERRLLRDSKQPTIKLVSVAAGYLDNRFHYEVKRKVEVVNLPPPHPGRIYLVSGLISEVADRDDVLTASFTGGEKDGDGNLVASRSLVRYTRYISVDPSANAGRRPAPPAKGVGRVTGLDIMRKVDKDVEVL
jgi:hypothetical protein